MSKVCLIKQPAGLGDILFCLKIVEYIYHLSKDTCRTIWPVVENYSDISRYINPSIPISFPCINDEFEYKAEFLSAPRGAITSYSGCTVLCLDGCTGSSGVMKAKYDMVSRSIGKHVDWREWQTAFSLHRHLNKEEELFDLVNPTKEPYILINQNVGTAPHFTSWSNIDPVSPLKKIYLTFVDGYSIFDWLMVVERAAEVHIEGSALTYIMEKLNISTEQLYLFSRDHNAIDMIFNLKWKKQ